MRLVILISMLTLSMITMAANITATVDRHNLAYGESLRVIFESDGSVDGDPDFSPLDRDFKIIANNLSSSMSIINGDVSRTKQWQLTLMPRRMGELTIPAIGFGRDKSTPVFINVTDSVAGRDNLKGDQDIFLEVEANPEQPYVQSQVIYTVRLYRAIATANASLSEPEVTGANAVIERIGEDKSYETRIKGKRYSVVERTYAIYPQASGKLTIGGIMFQGQPSRGSFFSFDPFGPQPEMIVRQSRPLTLEVLPIPESYTAANWLPARELTLTESWSEEPPHFKVGEPLTRTLTLSATGVTASQLPELPQWNLPGFKQYPDQPALEQALVPGGMSGKRVEKRAIIPKKAGEYLLPEISVPWWNTVTNRMEVARIPERRITVAAAAPQDVKHVNPAPLADLDTQTTEAAAADGGGIKPEAETLNAPQAAAANLWQWLSLVLAGGWLITLFVLWRTRREKVARDAGDNQEERIKHVAKALHKACVENSVTLAKNELLKWGRLNWPEKRPMSISEIGQRISPAMSRQIDLMNDALYSRQQGGWDGQGFWQVFKQEMNHTKRGKQQSHGDLEPLYRL